jgi:hypothetical protein
MKDIPGRVVDLATGPQRVDSELPRFFFLDDAERD